MHRIVCAIVLALPFFVAAKGYVRGPDTTAMPPDNASVRATPHAKANTIVNGGFETNGGAGSSSFVGWNVVQQGVGNWFVQSGTSSALGAYSVNAPPGGAFAAMSDQTGPGANYLYQDIVVPNGGATLSFDLLVANRHTDFVTPNSLDYAGEPNQQFRVDLVETGAPLDTLNVTTGFLGNLYATTVGSPLVTGYTRITRQIGNSSGQARTVRLRFAEIDNQTFFQIGLDNVSLDSGAPTVSSVSVSVNPSRITASGPVVLSWAPVNATGCVPSGGAPGTVFPTQQNNSVTVQVTVGATVRTDVFRVTCNGTSGTVSNSTVLTVGSPAPPPPAPVALISAGVGGAAPNGGSRRMALSDGGRFVAFESTASNLVAGDTNGQSDVFVRNTANGTIRRASVASGGAQSSLAASDAKISRDGNTVLFTQGTGGFGPAGERKAFANGQICLNNLATSAAECISKNPNGTPGNGASNFGDLSGDGTKVVYESTATNLVPQDGNGPTSDVFLFDKRTNATQLLSLTNASQAAIGGSFQPAISCDGRSYAFESEADLINGANATPGTRNVYAITSNGKRLVTVGLGNAAANGSSGRARIADGGRFVFFESSASNLVAGDTNGVPDVFVADLVENTIRRLSRTAARGQGNGSSANANIPCDGAWVTFDSNATNLVDNDTNGRTDVFIANLGSGTLAIASQSSGNPADGPSANGEVSPDGTAIGFDSDATNLGGGGVGSDVFAGPNPFARENYTGAWYDPAQAGHGLFLDQLPDGRLVAWWFTFDPAGAQAWFGGVGQIAGTSAVVSVVRTQGARFLPNFNPADAANTPIGTLSLSFTSCSSGRVDFALDSTFGNGSMNLTRLTTPIGVSCGSATGASDDKALDALAFFAARGKAVENTVGPIAGVTGAWYDPAQPGHGLFMENIGDGRVLVWWFTFGPSGGQAWIGNIATITSGRTATIDFLKTQGGRWIPNFNAANVTNPSLGPATITFANCDEGTVSYQLAQGYGTGQMILRPLLRPAGSSCSN